MPENPNGLPTDTPETPPGTPQVNHYSLMLVHCIRTLLEEKEEGRGALSFGFMATGSKVSGMVFI